MNHEVINRCPLTIEFMEKRLEVADNLSKMDQIITDRITYILQEIYSTFNKKFHTWFVDDGVEDKEDGKVGSLSLVLSKNKRDIHLTVYCTQGFCNFNILDKFGTMDNLCTGSSVSFPARWLTEPFEKELVNGKNSYDQQTLKEKRKKEYEKSSLKLKKQQLLESAKAKLSKEELEVLGIK